MRSAQVRTTQTSAIVLIVEDDALVGLDLSDALVRAGYRAAGPVDTLVAALARVRLRAPDLAVVDVRLKDGLCSELARELRRRDVPFVVHSAWRRDSSLCPELQEAPWLAKPTLPIEVVATLDRLRRRTR
ncbi:response regulator [Methylobacterium terricola]|uniref:Response regulator n=1 Tax=Methylobacterium terricola TaxID=2583531 RepID=A0A5C4LH41_9HYPH|nr:response regulator [Methylobacterium terricola]